jgi:hypothetical protein
MIGGYDLLLHLLSNIADLPVTKAVVKDSGMGKVIGSIEKHSMCVNGPNEHAIKSRVQHIKDSWNKSVKSKKAAVEAQPIAKRQLENVPQTSPTSSKRIKVEETNKRGASFSSLIKKVSGTTNGTTVLGSTSSNKVPEFTTDSSVVDNKGASE